MGEWEQTHVFKHIKLQQYECTKSVGQSDVHKNPNLLCRWAHSHSPYNLGDRSEPVLARSMLI